LSVSTVFGAETAVCELTSSKRRSLSGAHLSFVHLSTTTLISKCNSYFRTTQGNLLKSFPPKMAGQGDDDVAKQEYKMSGEWVENGKTSEFTL
jgi:hypothetical protein